MFPTLHALCDPRLVQACRTRLLSQSPRALEPISDWISASISEERTWRRSVDVQQVASLEEIVRVEALFELLIERKNHIARQFVQSTAAT